MNNKALGLVRIIGKDIKRYFQRVAGAQGEALHPHTKIIGARRSSCQRCFRTKITVTYPLLLAASCCSPRNHFPLGPHGCFWHFNMILYFCYYWSFSESHAEQSWFVQVQTAREPADSAHSRSPWRSRNATTHSVDLSSTSNNRNF